MDLSECFGKNLIKRTKVDVGLIKSLSEISRVKEGIISSAEIDEITIPAYVSWAYDSLREILEAICISRGFKVVSHLCSGELLRTLLDDFDFTEFDRMRYVRNGINYYGTKVQLNQGREMIRKMFAMKKSLSEKYLLDFLN